MNLESKLETSGSSSAFHVATPRGQVEVHTTCQPEPSCSTSLSSSIQQPQPSSAPDPKLKAKPGGGTTKPRKRAPHNRGNKLWEFIRDMLKDSETCPSVVRWEDPDEGVFRIVESEKLARLWGQRKNNHKMTYEKLSRAMRTYYDKKILVPVPKTGLYPKKLVYKFGPDALNWRSALEKEEKAVSNEKPVSKQTPVSVVSVKSVKAPSSDSDIDIISECDVLSPPEVTLD